MEGSSNGQTYMHKKPSSTGLYLVNKNISKWRQLAVGLYEQLKQYVYQILDRYL